MPFGIRSVVPLALAVASAAMATDAVPTKPVAADVVKIEVAVAPKPVPAGGKAEITVQLSVNPGFKLNKYPKIRLAVPAVEGLVSGAETSLGSDAPPPPDRLETNYFKSLDPLRLQLEVRPSASSGRHDIDAKLSYFYCVAASGYCARGRVPVKIPLTVR
jgi:hypothetical protein